MFKTIEELQYFLDQRPRGRDLKKDDMSRIKGLLADLNNPQDLIYNLIHVTGTNGKTSTSKVIQQVLNGNGYKTGLFISPFVESFNERIQINGINANDQQIISAANKIASLITNQGAFEILTAIALIIFAQEEIDVAIIEVGIGGQFDSTNVFQRSKVAVVTSVSLDHTEVLGDTIEQIAEQKAGIITPNSQIIIGPRIDERALAIVEQKAKTTNSQIFLVEPQENFIQDDMAIAMTAVEAFDRSINTDSIKIKLSNNPGRAELFSLKGKQILLDGAHNQEGILALSELIKQKFADQKISTLFGSLSEKNAINEIESIPGKVYQVSFVLEHRDTISGADWSTVFVKLLDSKEDELIVVTGSLYFVSQVRKQIIQDGAEKNTL